VLVYAPSDFPDESVFVAFDALSVGNAEVDMIRIEDGLTGL
jgi:hypothetical protein